jgi:Uma2 family endonuclease
MVTESRPGAPPRLVTADELLQLSKDDFYGELIRGELCEEMPPGFRHEKIVAKLIFLLSLFVEARALGTVIGGAGVRIERAPDTVRAPDVAFFDPSRISLDAVIPGYADVVPNLVIEVESPNDRRSQVHDKAHMWLYYGAEAVWVVQPEQRSVSIYRSGQDTIGLSGTVQLDGLDVLPGFRCDLSDIFGPVQKPTEPEHDEESTASA